MLRGRKLAAAAVAGGLVFTLGLTACGDDDDGTTTPPGTEGEPVRGGVLNMLGISDVDYIDPNVIYYSLGSLAARNWTRQLFTFPADPAETNGRLNAEIAVPDLATEIPTTDNGGISDDGKTVKIEIREGAQWNSSPPRQVTAADFVRGVKRTCNPKQPFGGLPDFQKGLIVGFEKFCAGFTKVEPTAKDIADYINNTDLEGVKVGANEREVVFTLLHPAAYLVDMLTMNAFSPAPEEYDAYLPGSLKLAQNTIADGPYMIESYNPTKKLTFVRNPAWNADSDPIRKAYVDKIIINMTVSQESTMQQLQTGKASADISFGNFPPPTVINGLIRKKDPLLTVGPSSSSNPYVIFNHVSPNNDNAMQKQAFREALMYGINRTNLIQSLGGPNVNAPLTHVLPADIIGGEENFDLYPYNVDTAKQKLTEAGFPDGVTLNFLYRPDSEGSRKSFATIQADLKKLGIDIKGVPAPSADFYTKYLQVPSVAKKGVWDLSLAGWGSDWYGNAALTFFKPLFYGEGSFPPVGSNFGFYDSQETIDLVDKADAATTEDEAKALWHDADMQVMKDAAFFPITNPKQTLYHAEQVNNAVYMPAYQGYDPTNIWLDADKQGG